MDAYHKYAIEQGLSSDPFDERHFYDYEAYYKEHGGFFPDAEGHLDSKYKKPGHPREIVDGVNTITGEKIEINELLPPLPPKSETELFPPTKPKVATKVGQGILLEPTGLDEKLWADNENKKDKDSWLKRIFKQSDEKQNARAQVTYNMSEMLGIPLEDAHDNLEAYSQALGIRGEPTTKEFTEMLFKFPIAAGLIANPIATGIGIAKFMAITEAENLILSVGTGTKYKFGEGKDLTTLLPEDVKPVMKDLTEVVDFLGKGFVLGKVDKQFGGLWKNFTKKAIEKYKLPLSVEKLQQNAAKKPVKTKKQSAIDLQEKIVEINKKKGKGYKTKLKAAQAELAKIKTVDGEQGESKVALTLVGKAIEKRLLKEKGTVSTYTKRTVRKQTLLSQTLLKDMKKARACIRGERPLPEGLRESSFFAAMDEYIRLNNPKNAGELTLELANSPLATAVQYQKQHNN